MQFTAQQIAAFLDGKIEGNAEAIIETFGGIEVAAENAITFLANMDLEKYLYQSKAAVVVIPNDLELKEAVQPTLIRVESPYLAMSQLMRQVEAMQQQKKEGVHETAVVSKSATLEEGVYVGALSVIESKVHIGAGTQIYPQVYLGAKVKVGKNCILYPGVKIYHDCEIGDDCILHGGVIVGGDGFGFVPDENGNYNKIPQLGKVIIKNKVEIGANSCVDRATFDATIIEDGVKIDNQVQVGHNVKIGSDTVLAAQVGIAGSATIGKSCMAGGQVGFADHITVADGMKFGAKSGVNKSWKTPNEVVMGAPAKLYKDIIRNYRNVNALGEMFERIAALEAALEQKKEES